MRGTVECVLLPTEDPEKVITCLKRVFPRVEFRVEGERVWGEIRGREDLERLREVVGREEVGPRFREVLKAGVNEEGMEFELDKEVLCVGKLSFGREGPVGTVRVRIYGNPNEIIDFLTGE